MRSRLLLGSSEFGFKGKPNVCASNVGAGALCGKVSGLRMVPAFTSEWIRGHPFVLDKLLGKKSWPADSATLLGDFHLEVHQWHVRPDYQSALACSVHGSCGQRIRRKRLVVLDGCFLKLSKQKMHVKSRW
jgi:hypothetical protein